jgi:hypothetical protein
MYQNPIKYAYLTSETANVPLHSTLAVEMYLHS